MKYLATVTGILLAMAVVPMAAAQASLSISPAGLAEPVGALFSIDVNVADVSDLYGFQFDVLFNPSVLQAVSSSEGSLLAGGGSTFFIPGSSDNRAGTVAATADTLLGPVAGVSGSGNIAVLTFEAIKSGVSSLTLSGVYLIDSAFDSIAASTTGGSVSVGAGGAMSAPEIDPASAASALTLLLGAMTLLRSRLRKVG